MEIVARISFMYFFLWALTRAMGKRELAEMTPFEMLLLVTVGDLVQQGVTQEDYSLIGAMLAVGTLALWVLLFSYVGFKFVKARPVVDGSPVVVVRDGRPVREALNIERVPLDDLVAEARNQGIRDLRDVELAILEPDGKFSFIRRREADDSSEAHQGDDRHRAK
jgi:uncharacterized membrane protein YcaP (DUF421 family)